MSLEEETSFSRGAQKGGLSKQKPLPFAKKKRRREQESASSTTSDSRQTRRLEEREKKKAIESQLSSSGVRVLNEKRSYSGPGEKKEHTQSFFSPASPTPLSNIYPILLIGRGGEFTNRARSQGEPGLSSLRLGPGEISKQQGVLLKEIYWLRLWVSIRHPPQRENCFWPFERGEGGEKIQSLLPAVHVGSGSEIPDEDSRIAGSVFIMISVKKGEKGEEAPSIFILWPDCCLANRKGRWRRALSRGLRKEKRRKRPSIRLAVYSRKEDVVLL